MHRTARAQARCLGAAVAACLASTLPANADEPVLAIYGAARFDIIYDDSRMSHPDVPLWVESEPSESGSELSMHPRLTRIGLSIEPWALGHDVEAEGAIEVDFQSTLVGQTASKPASKPASAALPGALRLRQAFVTFRRKRLEILAGQTWDLVAPLFPAANNDTMMWNAGNVGDRRPQLRVTMAPGDHLRLAMAAGMPGFVDAQDLDDDGRLDGVAGALPVLQALVEYRKRASDGGDVLRVGAWAHAGKQELGDGSSFASGAVGGHLYVRIARMALVLGEIFYGQSLGDIRGGIGQSVNLDTRDEIGALGGWLEAAVLPSSWYTIAVGGTIDRADPADLPDGARAHNASVYLVQRLRFRGAVQLGLEYLHWRTGYRGLPGGTANRVNLHVTLAF